eukprot:scaffold421397_cov61-Attheya_sp.AAC.1
MSICLKLDCSESSIIWIVSRGGLVSFIVSSLKDKWEHDLSQSKEGISSSSGSSIDNLVEVTEEREVATKQIQLGEHFLVWFHRHDYLRSAIRVLRSWERTTCIVARLGL